MHKNHGLISFKALSQRISDAWNAAPEEIKSYCKSVSKSELEKYRIKQQEFKEKYGEEAYDRQTRKRKNAERREEEAMRGKMAKSATDDMDYGKAMEKAQLDTTTAAAASNVNTTLEDLIRSSQQNQLRNLAYQRMYHQHLNNHILSQPMSMPYLGMGDDALFQREIYLKHVLQMRNDSLLRGMGLGREGALNANSTSAPMSAGVNLFNDVEASSKVTETDANKASTKDDSKPSSKDIDKLALEETKASAEDEPKPAADEAKPRAEDKPNPSSKEAKASVQDKTKPSATEITSAVDEAVLQFNNVNRSEAANATSAPKQASSQTLSNGALAYDILAQELNFRRRLEDAIRNNAVDERVDLHSLGDIQNRLALGSNLHGVGTNFPGLYSGTTQGSNVAQDEARLARAIQEERIATALRLRELEMSEQLIRSQSGMHGLTGASSYRNMLASQGPSLQSLRSISHGNHSIGPQGLDPTHGRARNIQQIEQRMLLLQEQMRREQEQYLLQVNQADALQRTLSAGISREVTDENLSAMGSMFSGEEKKLDTKCGRCDEEEKSLLKRTR